MYKIFSWLKPIILNKKIGKQSNIKTNILIFKFLKNKFIKIKIIKSQIIFNIKDE